MRIRTILALLALGLFAPAPVFSQVKKEKEQPAAAVTSRTILASLQLEIKSAEVPNQMKFSEFLEFAGSQLQKARRGVDLSLDDEAFRNEYGPDVPSTSEVEIRFRNLPPKTTIQYLLRQALKQLPGKAGHVVRAGRVDIVPLSRTSKEYMLNQTFHVDLKERRLEAALEELSELTGVSIVIDARAKQKIQTAVTAQFRDAVALQDAVRMLTDMAELKIVYLVTGIYVTTPEHAQIMQKELKQIYEGPTAVPGNLGGPIPGGPGLEPPTSPLAPPLPPRLRSRLDAAA